MSEPNDLEIYVDGLDGLLLGFPISKVRFSSINAHSDKNPPERHSRLTVAIPTAVLLQVCGAMTNTIREKSDQLKEAVNTHNAAFLEQLSTKDGASSPAEKKP